MTKRNSLILVGLLIAGVVAVSSAWLASSHPDGLERVAEDKGFIDTAEDPGYEILPDYTIPGIDGEISTALAGIVGVAIMLGVGLGAGYLLRRRSEDGADPDHPQRA
ncbi:MAG: PDGLE domain-containing protein [Dehalococcoidia bacterium]|nr:PDGLE domain-containing protein [Dehalococcoidia bacterium]